MENGERGALFETKRGKGKIIEMVFGGSMLVGILFIWFYRLTHFSKSTTDYYGPGGRILVVVWIGMFLAELFFGLYWLLTLSVRWNRTYRQTFKHRLSLRYEKDLPRVDIFVCTADPTLEPPIMVINTVLSVMAYDYPPEKLAVYLSDDGGSDLTFYALLEATHFSKHWIPYCKKYKVEPRSPAAYFNTPSTIDNDDLASIKELYEGMKNRIESATKLGRVPEEIREQHKGFSQWNSFSSRRDHDTILKVLVDGRESKSKDVEGCTLPTLVYLAREKRPQHPHNFKAGAMNALIRVSSKISNGQIILNVDCDMYSNSCHSIRDALCFFMDEQNGHEIAYVQFPQNFENVTKNEVYGSSLRVISAVDFHGLDGCGGPLYIGTGCFHSRDTLCGKSFSKTEKVTSKWKTEEIEFQKTEESMEELEENLKTLASCSYEKNTQWGNEMGLKYGCPVEDVITGLSIQCKGWKSVYYNPERAGFLGMATTTLDQTLVQHKRWSEGDFLILLSKYSPVIYGLGRIDPLLQMGYCIYCLWAPSSFPTLYYSIIPSLHLLTGVSLFPQISSPWFVPFALVIVGAYTHSLVEFLISGGTILGWWNEQRIWLYKRTSSYFLAFIDTILGLMGFTNVSFIVSTKVSDSGVSQRYKKEMIEFGTPSPMFTILSFIAMVNLFCFVGVLKKVFVDVGIEVWEDMALQIVLCAALVVINLPLYLALFVRKDKGKMPSSVTFKSVSLALFACSCFTFLY